ncbi:MAG TPA: amidoligase family protein [Tepidisphaeraceae bacterium]|nr:amidoligase family protein [Tepidisphaeraceae bacterium]
MEAAPSGMIQPFLLPPVLHNAQGQVRRAGFELEYAGVGIEESAAIVRDVFGGRESRLSTFQREVETDLGTFCVEIDTALLKDKKYETPLRALGLEPQRMDLQWLETALLGTFSTLVPIEVGSPPIQITDLAPLDELRRRLHEARARGTRASVLYAFGMHINPEIPSDDPGLLRDYLRAFLLLYPWIKERAEVDITRRITPYVNPFPDEYARLVLSPDYPASRERLIDDYLAHNPTRNRALDMLPVLAHLDAARVIGQVEDKHLVKPRPAFHYRLPNCMIDEPGWLLADEWNLWVTVERLAHDAELLAEMSRDYLRAEQRSFKPFTNKWPAVLETYVRAS